MKRSGTGVHASASSAGPRTETFPASVRGAEGRMEAVKSQIGAAATKEGRAADTANAAAASLKIMGASQPVARGVLKESDAPMNNPSRTNKAWKGRRAPTPEST